jgi:hypothetical protein
MHSLRRETFIAFWFRAGEQETYTHFTRFACHQTMGHRRTSILVKTNPFLCWKARSTFRLVMKRSQPGPARSFKDREALNTVFENNTQLPARLLVFVTPAGFENFFNEFAQPIASFDSPAIPASKDEVDKLLAAAPKYGLQILSPNK